MNRALLCTAVLCAVVGAALSTAQELRTAPPTPPVWPTQWYSDVQVTGWLRATGPSAGGKTQSKLLVAAIEAGDVDAGADPLQTLLPRMGYGQFYFDASKSAPQSASRLTDAVTGVRVRAWSDPVSGTVYTVEGSSGSCRSVPLQAFNASASNRWSVPATADFVSAMGFAFAGNDYLLRDGVYFWTQRWTWSSSAVTIDYYHAVVSGAPFRMVWTQSNALSLQPIVVVDFGLNVVASFDDVTNPNALFAAPSPCPAAPSPDADADDSGVAFRTAAAAAAPKAAPPAVGTPWPYAFSAAVRYTGNDMGLQPITPDALDEYVQQSLAGFYYYDWANNREASVWHDTGAGAVAAATKTVITGGRFYALDTATGTCVVPPTAPVNGPLRPTWPTNLQYVDTVVLQVQSNGGVSPAPATATTTYQVADHYRWDAFNASVDHSFAYWQQPDTGLPLQFAGPVLDFWPYYQSFMQYSEFSMGLNDIAPDTLATIFAVPALTNCTVIPQSVFLTPALWTQYDGASTAVNNRLFAAISASLAPFSAGADTRRALFQ